MQVQSIGPAVSPLESAPVQQLRELSAHAPARHLPASVQAGSPGDDLAATLTSQIAAPDLARLNAILQPNRSSEVAAHITELTQDTALALNEGDRTRALANLNEIAAADPHTVAVMAPDRVLQSIRPEVDQMLNRLTTVAKMDAEGWLAQADEAVETAGNATLTAWQSKPETLLQVAHHLYEAGGYTNYVRSADLAQNIVNPSAVAYSPFLEEYAKSPQTQPAAAPVKTENEEILPKKPTLPTAAETFQAVRKTAMPRLQQLWNRAPLLALLLAWLGAGLAAGPAAVLLRAIWPDILPASLIDFGFQVWATGFLGLVCFGFYARIRDVRA